MPPRILFSGDRRRSRWGRRVGEGALGRPRWRGRVGDVCAEMECMEEERMEEVPEEEDLMEEGFMEERPLNATD